jgi:AraC-like DNA-binding protein
LAAIALTCGYYDQAHLTREFGVFAGRTPTAYLRGLADKGAAPQGQISKTDDVKTCHGQVSESINRGA